MKPYIICYMMMSLDGRIDCGMTGQLKGVEDYYKILDELDIPSTISGRNTAELELSLKGRYEPSNPEIFGKDGFYKAQDAKGYEIVIDSKGVLRWESDKGAAKPHLIITSEKVAKEYLAYLKARDISYIVAGKEHVDLPQAMEVLAKEFPVKRVGVVGGVKINSSFLMEGLLDEIDILVGAGIDGREEMPSLFEGREENSPLPLKLKGVKSYASGAVLLRYTL